MRTIAFIESNTTGSGHFLLQKALQADFKVLFFARDPSRYSYLREEMIYPEIVDTLDEDELLRRLVGIEGLAAVLSTSEFFLETAASVSKRLGLFGSDPEAIRCCRDKGLLAEALTKAGIAVPRGRILRDLEGARAFWDQNAGPLVVKPVAGSGSIGVRLCRDRESFLMHVERLIQQTENERGLKVSPRVLAQEYIEGEEFSVEVFCRGQHFETLGITKKHLGPEPVFVEMGHDFPAVLPAERLSGIRETCIRALQSVGYLHGPAHVELRLCAGKPVIIEINPRLAGGMIPLLITSATGVDVLKLLLDLYLGLDVAFTPTRNQFASIRFVVPPASGTLASIHAPLESNPHVVSGHFNKVVGENLLLQGDFRDRIGWFIVSGATAPESRSRAEALLCTIRVEVAAEGQRVKSDTGRLKKELHPEALAIVRVPPSREKRLEELTLLTAIDEAHLLMLLEKGIIPLEKTRAILETIQNLKAAGFSDLVDVVAPRGIYLLYENELIEQLGTEVGGVLHTARSRNDIQATLFKLRARKAFQSVYASLWRLRACLLDRARSSLELTMPVYSQNQPGMPGSFGYYLLGVANALARDQKHLQTLLQDLNTSPLGAGAGCGTSFPIDPSLTSRLLGFSTACRHALDAVASRDLALRLLSCLAVTGVTISRITRDFQLWTTQEFAFFELPDELSGGSSMMPQKKNPYLLEIVQGRATAPMGILHHSMAAMVKTPFSNSVEVGTESLKGFEEAFQNIRDASILMSLIVQLAKPRPRNMVRSCEKGLVIASLVVDLMIKEKRVPFKEAHFRVGAAIAEAWEQNRDPMDALLELIPDKTWSTVELSDWVGLLAFGGGPGRDPCHHQLRRAIVRLNEDGLWLIHRKQGWNQATSKRDQEVARVLSSI